MMLHRRPFTWSVLKRLHQSGQFHVQKFQFHETKPESSTRIKSLTSNKIRKTFLEYFKEKDHQYVHSSSVIPKKNEGTYFVNAGMNQFKPIFLGTVDPDTNMANFKRVVNSQKCIRVGGKHNDLEDVGHDSYHHTLFEMLGSWSFGDYFKKETCEMAWELLTKVYCLPAESLYVTYFGGNRPLGLKPDTETRDIWLNIGVPRSHVLPFGMKDNFWDMGSTGPCGPCTEIHFDCLGMGNAGKLVNRDNPHVLELWNLVFMQYDRQIDGSLKKLPKQHVDTGMGLERITAVLQGKLSNYDTDLFVPIFDQIEKECKCLPYCGYFGMKNEQCTIDTAYRIVADHARMFTVSIADGLLPGRKDSESKLRRLIERCIKYSMKDLNAPQGLVGKLVPVVTQSLGEAFPELKEAEKDAIEIVLETEDRYLHHLEMGRKMMTKALRKSKNDNILTGQEIMHLFEGRYGQPISIDIIQDVAEDLAIELKLQEFEKLSDVNQDQPLKNQMSEIEKRHLNQHDISHLKEHNIATTDDKFKYENIEKMKAKILAIKTTDGFVDNIGESKDCGLLLDQTCFYAEGGGQIGDSGTVLSKDVMFSVDDAQVIQGYVVHSGTLKKGHLGVGDEIEICIDQEKREGCKRNHTATHVMNFALNKVLKNVRQQGSMVLPERFSFDFSSTKSKITHADLEEISCILDSMVVKDNVPVYSSEVPMSEAQNINGLRTLQDEVYPRNVRVVSIGVPIENMVSDSACDQGLDHSVELCGGTHVSNTSKIGAIAITGFEGMLHGTKRVTAVTGDLARQVLDAGRKVQEEMEALVELVDTGKQKQSWPQRAKSIEKTLFNEDTLLPKLVRDNVLNNLEELKQSHISQQKNLSVKEQLTQNLTLVLQTNDDKPFVVAEMQFKAARDMVDILSKMDPDKPVFVFCSSKEKKNQIQGVSFVPESKIISNEFNSELWANHVMQALGGSVYPPKGKHAQEANRISICNFKMTEENNLSQSETFAKTFAQLFHS